MTVEKAGELLDKAVNALKVLRYPPETYEIVDQARETAIKRLRDAINYCVFAILSLEPEQEGDRGE